MSISSLRGPHHPPYRNSSSIFNHSNNINQTWYFTTPTHPSFPPHKERRGISIGWELDEIIVFSVEGLSSLICLCLFVLVISLYLKKDSVIKAGHINLKIFYVFLVICTFLFGMTSFFVVFHTVCLEEQIYKRSQQVSQIISLTLQLLWFFSRMLLYIYFAIRLRLAFQQSVYQYSIKLISIMVVIITFLGIIQIAVKILSKTTNLFDNDQLKIIDSVIVVKDILIPVIEIILFVRVLLKLITSDAKSRVHEHYKMHSRKCSSTFDIDDDEPDANLMEIDEDDELPPDLPVQNTSLRSRYSTVSLILDDYSKEELIDPATKTTILGFIALMTTIIAILVKIILDIMVDDKLVYEHYLLITISMDSMVNTLCIYLSFSFSKLHYKRLCGCLHNKCRTLFVMLSKIQVASSKENVELYIDEHSSLSPNNKLTLSMVNTNSTNSSSSKQHGHSITASISIEVTNSSTYIKTLNPINEMINNSTPTDEYINGSVPYV